MGIEGKMKDKKNKILVFLLTFFFIVLCVGISAGAIFYNYLSGFSKDFMENQDSVKPYEVKSKNAPVNILVMGVDVGTLGVKEEDNNRRTDTIILMNYNPESKKVNLVSIPRDTLIVVGKKNQKINAAHAIGGVQYLIEAVEQLLDIRINYYGKVDYVGFREIIDTIGGIDITIPNRMDYDDAAQNLHIHFKKGETVHLDGKKAEEFFRWRKNNDGTGLADGDLGRIENQHLFIEKVIDKFKSVSIIPKIPDILKVIPKYCETNMGADAILRYGIELAKVDKENIAMETLQGDLADIDGFSYLIYDKKKNTKLLSLLHSNNKSYEVEEFNKKKIRVQVQNGTKISGLARNFSEIIKDSGYNNVSIANGKASSNTTVIVYGLDKKFIDKIKEDFGINNIVYSSEKSGNFDIVVLLGNDYKSK